MNELIVRDVHKMKERINDRFASLIIVDGQQGHGKTTFAVEYAELYQGSDLDYEVQYAMGGDDFISKLRQCKDKNYPVIIYDEAGDFDKKSTMSKFNRRLNYVFQKFRAFRILIIVVLPFFGDLDNGLVQKAIPRILYHIHRVQIKDKDGNVKKDAEGNNITRAYASAYELQRMAFMQKEYREKKPAMAIDVFKSKHPNYRVTFANLPPKKSKMLDELTVKQKRDSIEELDLMEDHIDIEKFIAKPRKQEKEDKPLWEI